MKHEVRKLNPPILCTCWRFAFRELHCRRAKEKRKNGSA